MPPSSPEQPPKSLDKIGLKCVSMWFLILFLGKKSKNLFFLSMDFIKRPANLVFMLKPCYHNPLLDQIPKSPLHPM